LAQEPVLDESKNVGDNILDGVAEEKREIVAKFQQLSAKLAETPEAEIDDAIRSEYASLKSTIEAQKLDDLTRKIQLAIHALKCPPYYSPVNNLSGVSVNVSKEEIGSSYLLLLGGFFCIGRTTSSCVVSIIDF
jgi:ATPase subunit of ABC transporter with duplicated ATPase domains